MSGLLILGSLYSLDISNVSSTVLLDLSLALAVELNNVALLFILVVFLIVFSIGFLRSIMSDARNVSASKRLLSPFSCLGSGSLDLLAGGVVRVQVDFEETKQAEPSQLDKFGRGHTTLDEQKELAEANRFCSSDNEEVPIEWYFFSVLQDTVSFPIDFVPISILFLSTGLFSNVEVPVDIPNDWPIVSLTAGPEADNVKLDDSKCCIVEVT